MGYKEDLDAMGLADDVKARLLLAHEAEINPLLTENSELKGKDLRDAVATEIKEFADAGWSAAPGALAFARRVFLSPDANEVGAVLLSDAELMLSGDEATGARVKEDVSAAHVLRTFMGLLPKTAEGKLNLLLSDQGVAAEDHGRPANTGNGGGSGDNEDDKAAARSRAEKALGRKIDRPSRSKRYGDSVVSGAAGGD